jgi:hypothetical protein
MTAQALPRGNAHLSVSGQITPKPHCGNTISGTRVRKSLTMKGEKIHFESETPILRPPCEPAGPAGRLVSVNAHPSNACVGPPDCALRKTNIDPILVRMIRLAAGLWHPCVDVYVSNPQATVVARSNRDGAGRKPGRAVAEIQARVRGASADRVRGRAPWRSCPNRAGTRRHLAVAAIGGIRSRA